VCNIRVNVTGTVTLGGNGVSLGGFVPTLGQCSPSSTTTAAIRSQDVLATFRKAAEWSATVRRGFVSHVGGDGNDVTLTSSMIPQTITFGALGDKTFGDAAFPISDGDVRADGHLLVGRPSAR
jgi:hypothetical protein